MAAHQAGWDPYPALALVRLAQGDVDGRRVHPRMRVCLAAGEALDAERHFSEAARLWKEIGAPYEEALARAGLAEAHRAAGRDAQAALRSRAVRTILDRIEQGPAPGAVEAGRTPDGSDERSTGTVNVFRREGDYRSVGFDGRTVRVRSLRGMPAPRRAREEFHVLDLVAE
jgi:hypothetical protein